MSKEKETLEENKNDLLAFNWEEEEDFFVDTKEEVEEPVKTTEEEEEIEDVEETKEKKTSKKKIEDEEEDDFFDETIESKTKETEETTSIYLDVLKDLKEQGIFKHIEIDEDEEIDAEKLFELQAEEYELEVAQRLDSWANEELDPDAQAFIKFKLQGGRTEDFFREYSKNSEFPEGDIDDEFYQDEVIRFQLKEEGWSSDEIEDRLEFLEGNGKKKDFARRYEDKIKTKVEQKKQLLLEQAEQQKQSAKQQEETFKSSVKSALSEIKEVKGFKITDKEKDNIYDLLTKRNYKLAENKMITGFQKKMGDVLQDTEKLILLAKLIDSDFDFTSMQKQIETKKTKEIKSNLQKNQGLKSRGFGSSTQGKSLADLFD